MQETSYDQPGAPVEPLRTLPAALAGLSDACLAGLAAAVVQAGDEVAATAEAARAVACADLGVARAEIAELRLRLDAMDAERAARDAERICDLDRIAGIIERLRGASADPCETSLQTARFVCDAAGSPVRKAKVRHRAAGTVETASVESDAAEPLATAPPASPPMAPSETPPERSAGGATEIRLTSAPLAVIEALDQIVAHGEYTDHAAAVLVLVGEALARRDGRSEVDEGSRPAGRAPDEAAAGGASARVGTVDRRADLAAPAGFEARSRSG